MDDKYEEAEAMLERATMLPVPRYYTFVSLLKA